MEKRSVIGLQKCDDAGEKRKVSSEDSKIRDTLVMPTNSHTSVVFDSYTGKRRCIPQYNEVNASDSGLCLSRIPHTSNSMFDSQLKINYSHRTLSTTNESNDSKMSDSGYAEDILMRSFVSREEFKRQKSTSSENNTYFKENDTKTSFVDWSMSGKESFTENMLMSEDSSIRTSGKIVQYLPNNKSTAISNCNTDSRWDNPVFGANSQSALPTVVKHTGVLSRKSFDRVYNTFSFTKEMLKNVEVIGQVDDKFIACVLMTSAYNNNVLVLLDQHAAHERIRLEQLLKQIGYYSHKRNQSLIKNQTTRLLPPALVMFYENEVDLIEHYRKEFNDIGLYFTQIKPNKVSTSTMRKFLISSVPNVFVNVCDIEPEVKGSVVNTTFIKEFMQEQIKFMRTTSGHCNMASTTIFKVLASYACHGAIKFGDKLSMETCRNIISELSKCNLPFQCAHGRPSIAPLLNLNMLSGVLKKNIPGKPNLSKLKLLCR